MRILQLRLCVLQYDFWIHICRSSASVLKQKNMILKFLQLWQVHNIKKSLYSRKNLPVHQLFRQSARQLGQFLHTFLNWNWKNQKIDTLCPYIKFISIKVPWISDLTYNWREGFVKTWWFLCLSAGTTGNSILSKLSITIQAEWQCLT